MAIDHDDQRRSSAVPAALAVLGRRTWLALSVFVAAATTFGSVAAFLPSVYQSTATVAVYHRNVPETFVKSTVTGGVETRLHLINQDILSTRRLDDLIGRLDPYFDTVGRLPKKDRIERMRRDTRMDLKSVERKGQGDAATIAFAITHRGPDPMMVARVANTLASSYVEENVKARAGQATATAAFLRGQLEETKAKLDAQERRLEEFNQKNVGSLPQQMGINIVAAERLQTDLRINAENQRRARERREGLADVATDPSTRRADAPLVASARAARLARLRDELAELRRHYTDRYPDVTRLSGEIAELEQRPDDAPVAAAPPADPAAARRVLTATQIDAELRALAGEERRLRDQLATYQARIDQAPKHEQHYRQLTRDYETTRDLYQSLLTRYGEAQMGESIEQGRQTGEEFRLVEPAVPAEWPIAPRRTQLFLVGLAVSLGLAVLAVIVAEQVDTSFHTGDDLRAFTAVPIAATIPPIVTAGDRRDRRWRRAVTACATVALLVGIVGVAWLAVHGNYQLVAMLTPAG